MAKIDIKETIFQFKDGVAEVLTIKVGEGTLTYTESREMEYALDRGLLDTVREGDQIPIDVSFDLVWETLKALTSSTPTPEEALKKEGAASTWVSTSSDVCEPFAIDIVITNDPVCATQDLEEITLPDFRFESIDHDVREGTLAVTGRCNAIRSTIVHFIQTT